MGVLLNAIALTGDDVTWLDYLSTKLQGVTPFKTVSWYPSHRTQCKDAYTCDVLPVKCGKNRNILSSALLCTQ